MDHPSMHAWDQVAAGEAEEAQAEEMRRIEQEDLDANAALTQQQQTTPLLQRFVNRELIPPDKYRELVRGLNTKQRQAMNFHRRWCKDAIIAMKKGETIKPYRVSLSGPGGVGKSYMSV